MIYNLVLYFCAKAVGGCVIAPLPKISSINSVISLTSFKLLPSIRSWP